MSGLYSFRYHFIHIKFFFYHFLINVSLKVKKVPRLMNRNLEVFLVVNVLCLKEKVQIYTKRNWNQ